ncbi:NUDIX domain-containing protein [Palleronia sp.]|uniref:NUDIX hydrolase n=1 Tax=Palleronia sp. TaxID=1940284 RepID=UPI0035C81129
MGQEDARVLRPDRIRDAATVIVVRDAANRPRILMGQRGRAAAFMPNKVVFPGGAVDAADAEVPLAFPLADPCRSRLDQPGEAAPEALAAAAIRELWEETGQIAGVRGAWDDAPPGWRDFAATGHRPDPRHLRYVFRAITPPGRPRRFDARFFLLPAERLATDPDDVSRADGELRHLAWVELDAARKLDLPFVTAVALGEIAAHLPRLTAPDRVPFFGDDRGVTDAARPRD